MSDAFMILSSQHRSTSIHPIAAAAALLCAPAAWAQQAVLMPVVTIQAQSAEGLGLKREIGSASRLGLTAQETPASVESLAAATIAARGDVLVKDAVTRTTGLTDISSPGNGIAYAARGFSGNSAIAILENGQRPQVGSGTATYPSDPWGYEVIEVLRGPGSVVHGSGSTGATINAVRKAPSRASAMEAMAGIGAGRALRAGLGASGALGQGGAFRVDASGARGDGLIDRGDSRSGKLLTSAAFALTPVLDLELQLDHAQQKPQRYFGTPLVDGHLARSLRRQNYNVDDAEIDFRDDKALARLTWRITPGLTVSNELAYMTARRSWRNLESYVYSSGSGGNSGGNSGNSGNSGNTDGSAAGLVERSDYIAIGHDQEQAGNRLEARWNAGANRLVGGWEAATINFTHTNNAPYGGASSVAPTGFDPGRFYSPDLLRPNFTTDTVTNAVYAEDAYRLSERLLLLAGLRHDRYRVERTSLLGAAGFGATLQSTAARLGLTWTLAPESSLYAQASSGSDPVTSLLSLNLANSRYKLTSSRQLETGIKQSLAGGKAEWTAALYRIRKDDIITRDPLNPALSIQGGAQSSRGVEVSASVALAPAWRVEGNAVWTDARFDQLIEGANVSRAGKRPADTPRSSANVWLNYRAGGWRAAAGARYVGKRFIDNANLQALPAYTSFDASAGWQAGRHVLVQLNLRNLGDRLYASSSYGSSQYLLGARRHAELTVQWRY